MGTLASRRSLIQAMRGPRRLADPRTSTTRRAPTRSRGCRTAAASASCSTSSWSARGAAAADDRPGRRPRPLQGRQRPLRPPRRRRRAAARRGAAAARASARSTRPAASAARSSRWSCPTPTSTTPSCSPSGCASRVRNAFADDAVPITISFGVASFPAHAETAASLLRAADEALTRRRRAGATAPCSTARCCASVRGTRRGETRRRGRALPGRRARPGRGRRPALQRQRAPLRDRRALRGADGARAGPLRATRRARAARRPAARHRQGRGARRDPAQAGQADRRGVRDDPAAPGARRADPRAPPLADVRGVGRRAPRAPRRHRLPHGPVG